MRSSDKDEHSNEKLPEPCSFENVTMMSGIGIAINGSASGDQEDDWVPLSSTIDKSTTSGATSITANSTSATSSTTSSTYDTFQPFCNHARVNSNDDHNDNDDSSHAAAAVRFNNSKKDSKKESIQSSSSHSFVKPKSKAIHGSTMNSSTTMNGNSRTDALLIQHHETRHKIKQDLVDRPLSKFWRLVIVYLMKEIWACHVLIRLGIIFLFFGCILQSMSIGLLLLGSVWNLLLVVLGSGVVGGSSVVGGTTFILLIAAGIPVVSYVYIVCHSLKVNTPPPPPRGSIPRTNMERFLESIQVSFTLDYVLEFIVTCLENGHITTNATTALRGTFLGLFFGLPILMQSRALLFLSHLVVVVVLGGDDAAVVVGDIASSSITSSSNNTTWCWWSWWWSRGLFGCSSAIGWKVMSLQLAILLPFHFYIGRSSSSASSSSSSLPTPGETQQQEGRGQQPLLLHHHSYSIGPIRFIKKPSTTMMDCRIHSWISLYITAFLATTLRIERDGLYTPIFLAGPFFLALGSFIILSLSDDGQNAEDILSNVIRNALRRALLDVLSSIEEDVTEDEMLRLAMLRWIVDYWASSKKPSKSSAPSTPSSSQTNRSSSNPSSSRNTSCDGNEDDEEATATNANNSPKAFVVKASLIKEQGQGSNKKDSSTSSSTDINQPQDNRIGWHDLSTMLDKTTEQMYNEVNSSRNECLPPQERNHTTSTSTTSSRHQQNHSVRNLRYMISSFDVDERAKPAVLLYKHAVDGFPPSPNLSIAFALASRCPAILSVLYLHLIGSVHAINCTLTLFPMMIYEVVRVIDWVRRCRHFVAMKRPTSSSSKLPSEACPFEDEPKGEYFVPHFLREMESMEILLLDSSSLLRVWENVDSSVNALESGLTAMRCVNTLHVATDLVFNVASLATFAVEVGNHGWLHGIQVLGSDLLHFHMKNTGRSTSEHLSERGKESRARYSNAAVELVKNSQHLTRNMEALIDESKNETNFISCLLHSVLELFWGEEGRLKSTDETNNHAPSNNNVHILLPVDSELESPAINIPSCVLETTTNLSGACREENVQMETISIIRNENDLDDLRDEMPSSHQPMLTIGINDLEVNFYQDEECSRTRSNDDDENEIPHNEANSNDDDDSWTAIHEEEKIPELKETPHPEQYISCTFNKKEIQDEGEYEHSQINESVVDDAGIKWVGTAGIAILGAVAGSILLASKNNGDTLDDDKNKEDNVAKNRRSTVESIELVLEDE